MILSFIVTSVIVLIFFWWQNNRLVVSNIKYESNMVPAGFDKFTILHLSDLHNKTFGKEQSKLIKKTIEISPDIIVITGDLIDGRNKTDIDSAMAYIKKASLIAPVYFAAGNHEKKSNVYEILKKRLEEENVVVLDDAYILLKKDDDVIKIIGIRDPRFTSDKNFEETLKNLIKDKDTHFKMLLSHRPEKLPLYSKLKINIVFSGHAHGGQVRLPLIGGIISPHQGFFPKYTSGLIKNGNTSLVVSRGLGNSLCPIRVFNYPELLAITFYKKQI